MKNTIMKLVNSSVIPSSILLVIQAILTFFFAKINSSYIFVLLAIMIPLYAIIILIKKRFDFPDNFTGKLPYNMSIKESKYNLGGMCRIAKKKIFLAGPNQSFIFGYEKQEQSDAKFKELIGDKIINNSVDVFIIIMDYEKEWIKTLNSFSSGHDEEQYRKEENRVKSYLENFDNRLKIIYTKAQIEIIEKHLSIYKVNFSLNSICLIDDKQGYLQLVDKKTKGAERTIFYINNYDKKIINSIYTNFSYYGLESIWRKENNNTVFDVNKNAL